MLLGSFPSDCLENCRAKLEKIISDNKAELERLLGQKEKNYISFVRPFMEAGERISVFFTPISHLQSVQNSAETQEAFADCIEPLTVYSTELLHNKDVYNAFAEIRRKEYENLSPVARKVLDDAIFDFELEGVNLSGEEKNRIREINVRLSELSDQFSQNLLDATNAYKIVITDAKILGEMPESDKTSAKCDNGWEFTLQMPSYTAFMTYVINREKREEVYRAYSTRAPENSAIITEILALRDEKTHLLGYSNFAELNIRKMSAPSVLCVISFLRELGVIGKPYAVKDKARLAEFAAKDGIAEIEAFDINYYSNKFKKVCFDYDEEALRPYFEQNTVVNGLFSIIKRLFNIDFTEKPAKLWHEKAKYFEISEYGTVLGGLFMDLEARPEKRSGAWMNNWHTYHRDASGKGHLPQAFIVANFPVSKPDNPSLLRHDDVTTLFHEMGHALHHLLSETDELSVSGVNGIDWDTVEFPSQFLENYAYSSEVLDTLGIHYKTCEKLPPDLREKVVSARNFQAAMALVRQVEFALFDMLIHLEKMDEKQVQTTLNSVREEVAVIIPPGYNLFQNGFSHIFSGGYAAGYYSYKWAEMLSSDAFCAFTEKGLFDKDLAKSFRDNVLGRGAGCKMSEIYRDFLGRDPDHKSILKYAGLV
ncbi:MAG: M3 family metallopeptidase [Deferribacteraceae bacterium]|jgi:oligopeptidase A|nr:M3 family metallopeptidase [Deferribacteraceae bacterium]